MKIVINLKIPNISAWTFSKAQLSKLQEKLPKANITLCDESSYFKDELKTADIAIGWFFKQEWIDNAENLKVLATPAAGKDYFKVDLPQKVQTINGSFHGQIMAETALAMILSHSRRLIDSAMMMKNMRNDENLWPRISYNQNAKRVSASTLMIIGFGSIGKHTGKLAKALGMNIVGINRNNTAKPDYFTETDVVYKIDKLNSLLPNADHLLLIMPSHKSSDNILNANTLKILKPDVGIYNIGRGNAIDEEALCDFLVKNPAAAAYLDVFKEEPLPAESRLRNINNAHLMPHACAIAPDYLDLFIEDFCSKLQNLNLD